MMHDYKTQKGDSGTPFIAQPNLEQNALNECFIVGIHVALHINKNGEVTKKGVRMTQTVIQRLKKFIKDTFGSG